MDPTTVILILALNLLAIGLLLAMIGRRMDQAEGMRGFATGSVVFGLAYLLRLALGHQSSGPASVLPDTLMFYATLCYAAGMRRFSGMAPLGQRFVLLSSAGFGGLSLAATLVWQDVGRHAVLNGGLALNYSALAVLASLGRRRVGSMLNASMNVLAAVTGVLGALTLARSVVAVFWGVAPLFAGLAAQIYYAYATIVTVVLGPVLLWMVFNRLNERLAELASHDPLTGLLNRNGLADALRRHFGARPAPPLVLCQIDIDHFKHINDAHGHAAGDAVLQGVAQVLMAHVRACDFVARLGGEEFLVGCSGAPAQAAALAERLRLALADQPHPVAGFGQLRCTVSIGVSRALAEAGDWEAALREADAALYRAKQAGRNRVVLAAEAGSTGPPGAPIHDPATQALASGD
jgi:diguanylate cyclase (GGDEF)-like protein